MFLLIMTLLGAAGVFFLASSTQYSGWSWSYALCQQGAIFCDHPSWILIGAGVLILLEMMRTMSET
ncbi:MAG: hypothetical protein EKK40_02350 [Bradyrhizobiaceae bacterium]|nr:MAG: hypothetical protein EKK40_02350 [Bradyrhizobiaceae bacterium]